MKKRNRFLAFVSLFIVIVAGIFVFIYVHSSSKEDTDDVLNALSSADADIAEKNREESETETKKSSLYENAKRDEKGRIVVDKEEYFVARNYSNGVIELKEIPIEPFVLRIPVSFEGKLVSSLWDLRNCAYVEEIYIPQNVYMLPIDNCRNLKAVHIGKKNGTKAEYDPDDYESFISKLDILTMITNCESLETIEIVKGGSGGLNLGILNGLPSLKSLDLPDNIVCLSGISVCGIVQFDFTEHCLVARDMFTGMPELREVYCNQELKLITRSFVDAPKLEYVEIPSMDTEIEKSFINCPELVLGVLKGSKAEEYALNNSIKIKYLQERQ